MVSGAVQEDVAIALHTLLSFPPDASSRLSQDHFSPQTYEEEERKKKLINKSAEFHVLYASAK